MTTKKTPKTKPKAAKAPVPRKRIEYTAALGEQILDHIIDGKTLAAIEKTEGMPSRTMILKWRRQYQEFGQLYDDAVDARADADADEVDELARMIVDGKLDFNAGRVAIDAKKWSSAHRAPRRYGTKLAAELTGKDGGPILTAELSTDYKLNLARQIALMLTDATPVNGEMAALNNLLPGTTE
jgi:hypothetical protein